MLTTVHEVPQQLDEALGVQPLGVHREPEGAERIDGRDGAHALSLAAGRDLGGLPPNAPGAPEDVIGADASLVEKEDLRADAPGAGAQLREHRRLSALDRHGIALVGAPQRLLGGDVQLGKQPTDGGHAQLHAAALRDQGCHDLPSPQPEIETVLARVLAIDPAPNLQFLLWGQSCFGPDVVRREGRSPPRFAAVSQR